MKYGVAVPNFGKFAGKDHILELSLAAEEFGYDSLWVSDHIVVPKGHKGFGNTFFDPISTLSFLAAKTNKIKLGTSVIVLPYRNPVVFAKEISTIDVLSDGRVILGIGAGWLKEEFDALGVDFKNRGKITDEYLEVINELYLNENPGFSGRFFEFSNIDFFPKPFNNRIPEIWVGGGSPNALKRAVRYGSGWHAVGSIPSEIKDRMPEIKELLTGSDNNLNDFVVSVRKNLHITDKKINDEREVLRGSLLKIRRGLEDYRMAGVGHIVFQVLGNKFQDIIKTMKEFKEKLG